MSQIRTLLSLSGTEWRLLAFALPLVLAIRIALWVLPSRRILRVAAKLSASAHVNPSASSPSSAMIVWAIGAASRCIPQATCLTQALAAQFLLGRFGMVSRLCLGVASSENGTFRAHAWLERDGRPLLGGAGIQALTRLPELRIDASARVVPPR